MSNPRVIAFYLPQYHPTPNNDIWWGKGFTEWTNVGRAKSLFPGHHQPNVPGELGYYDLRLPIVRQQQAEMAADAGVEGFCYYHYWFEAGKEELDIPFKEVVSSGKPDFPFCLCWANQSWENKMWDKNGSVISSKILCEQKYLGEEDNKKHFYSLLSAFKDKRYIKVDGRPIFMIYQPLLFNGIEDFIGQWNELAIKNGINKFFFVGQCGIESEIEVILKLGFDAINYSRLFPQYKNSFINKLLSKIIGRPRVINYKDIIPYFNSNRYKEECIYPVIIPNWDHTPRSGKSGLVYQGSTPELFKAHVGQILNTTKNKRNNIIFLKSWNEWGEGNYMEPDLRFGRGYINALSELISKYNKKSP